MNEQEFKKELLVVIKSYNEAKLNKSQFVLRMEDLAKKCKPKRVDEFQDQQLGEAMMWIDEIAYYGIDDVMANKFNFINYFLNNSHAN